MSSYMMYSVRNGENLNPYNFTLQQNPLGRPYDDNGNLIFSPTNDALLTNPLAEMVPGAQVENRKKYRIFNSIYAEVDILDGLKYRVNFGPDFTIQPIWPLHWCSNERPKIWRPAGPDCQQFIWVQLHAGKHGNLQQKNW